MILLRGKGVSKGVTNGPIYFFQRPNTDIVKITVDDVDAEEARIAAAQEKSIDQLNALAEKAREETGDETAMPSIKGNGTNSGQHPRQNTAPPVRRSHGSPFHRWRLR